MPRVRRLAISTPGARDALEAAYRDLPDLPAGRRAACWRSTGSSAVVGSPVPPRDRLRFRGFQLGSRLLFSDSADDAPPVTPRGCTPVFVNLARTRLKLRSTGIAIHTTTTSSWHSAHVGASVFSARRWMTASGAGSGRLAFWLRIVSSGGST